MSRCQAMWEIQDGFSSEEQAEEEFIGDLDNYKFQEWPTKISSQSVPPPEDIKNKTYSLYPDLITGWLPKFYLPEPVPLQYSNQMIDKLVDFYFVHYSQFPQLKLCYLGPRQQTSYFAWLNKQFEFPYSHISVPKQAKLSNRRFCGNNPYNKNINCLQFDSLFESGNLDCAFQIEQFSYELFMRVDSNTRGHLQWFNFKVKNMQKNQTYHFYISNFQKGNLLFAKNAKPYIFSRKGFEYKGNVWQQQGENIKFYRKIPKTTLKLGQEQEDDKKFNRLSFTYTCQYDQDQVQFAYCIPYTYSQMKSKLQQLTKSAPNNILKIQKLTHSLGGLDIPLLTITSNVDEEIEARKNRSCLRKKIIIASGRIHPGQSNGSYMIQGFIEFLLSDNSQAKTLRDGVIFKIVPMLNPDGVVLGNYRTGLSGRDLNREFIEPDADIFPEIVGLKQLVKEYKKLYQKQFCLFLDFHGHSIKKNVFMYGPEFPITDTNYYQCRIFPKLISLKTEIFRFYSCSFKVSEAKQSTARAVILRSYKIPLVYTIEASNGFYKDRQNKNIPFCQQSWRETGGSIAKAFKDYYMMMMRLEQERAEKAAQRKLFSQKKQRTKQQLQKKIKMNKKRQLYLKTSMSFNENRNSTQFINFIDQSNLMLEKDKQCFDQILFQLKEEKKAEKNKDTDDEISQGNSDQEGPQNDLQTSEIENLFERIKNKDKRLGNKQRHKRNNTSVQFKKNQQKSVVIIDQNKEIEEVAKILPLRSKDITLKRHLLMRKKPNTFLTPSPKKEDKPATAKIVTFDFGINAIKCDEDKSQNRKQLKNNPNKRIITETTIDGMMSELRRIPSRPRAGVNFSDTFRITFMSVQKQIVRRQRKKSLIKQPIKADNFSKCKKLQTFNLQKPQMK